MSNLEVVFALGDLLGKGKHYLLTSQIVIQLCNSLNNPYAGTIFDIIMLSNLTILTQKPNRTLL